MARAQFHHAGRPRAAGARSRRHAARLLRLALHQAHDVLLWIAELREGDHVRDLRHRDDRLAALLADLVENGLRVVDLDVDRDGIALLRRITDPAADSAAAAADHPVRHLAGRLLVLPAEDVRVELLERRAVRSHDLEPRDLARHAASLRRLPVLRRRDRGGSWPPLRAIALGLGDKLLEELRILARLGMPEHAERK